MDSPKYRVIARPSVEKRRQQRHNNAMTRQITIKKVPDEVHKELKERAALKGQSMQEYLRRELERIVSIPSPEMLMERIRKRKMASGNSVKLEDILEAKYSDRA